MKTSYLMIAVALLVGIGLVYLFSGAGNSFREPQVNVPVGGGPGEVNVPQLRNITVEARPFEFTPNEIRVEKGDVVRITLENREGFHDFVIDGYNVNTKQIQAGDSDSVTFVADKAGEFEFFCSVGNHRQMGMVGKFIVEE